MNNDEFFESLNQITVDFVELLQDTIKKLWNAQSFNLSMKDEYQVIFGLLSRQATLSIRFVNAYSFWNHDMAPIVMRCLADNLINLKWIVGDVSERSDRFVKFGLGQEKLNIEQRKVQLEKDGKDPQSDPVIQAQERWLSTYRFPMITDVDLGSWSGITTRQMAIDADCLDFYNYVYMPFSCAVHSQWNHIIKHNMRESENPLHCSLLYPILEESPVDIYYLVLTAKYFDRAIEWANIWDQLILPADYKGSYEWIMERIQVLE